MFRDLLLLLFPFLPYAITDFVDCDNGTCCSYTGSDVFPVDFLDIFLFPIEFFQSTSSFLLLEDFWFGVKLEPSNHGENNRQDQEEELPAIVLCFALLRRAVLSVVFHFLSFLWFR